MDRIVGIVLQIVCIFFGIMLLLLGLIWLMGSIYTSYFVVGVVMIIMAFGLFGLAYLISRAKAKQPTVVQQTVNVQLGGSGEFKQKAMKCRSCGGDIGSKDTKVISGGLQVTCPYCGTTYNLEEQPKW